MRVKCGDVRLFFDVVGPQLQPDGEVMVRRPTLLLLHGGPGFDHSHYRPAFDVLAQRAQVVLLDHRGQGRSERSTPDRWTLADWADDVAAFCRALEIERPILLGASFGGFVALAAAARHPQLASGLILLGSAARISVPRVVERFGELGGPAARSAAERLFQDPDDPAVVARYMEICFPLYAVSGFNPLLAARSKINLDVSASFFRPGGEYSRFDLRPALASLQTPALLLHGALDPIVPVEFAVETAAAFPPGLAELAVFPDCAHDVERDKWPEAAARIEAFIEARGRELALS